MTTREKLIRRKQSLRELTEYLQSISQVCNIRGVSSQHFHGIKKAYGAPYKLYLQLYDIEHFKTRDLTHQKNFPEDLKNIR